LVLVGESPAGVPIVSNEKPPAHLKRRIAVIDGYRAVAILSVLSYHYTVRWAPPEDPGGLLMAGKMFDGIIPLEYGWLGVEFFFAISGFVILMTLESCASVTDFVFRRFARLWPAMLVAATLTTLVITFWGPDGWSVSRYDYFSSVLLMDPSISSLLLHRPTQWVDGAYWSLWVEIQFYVLAAAVYLLVRKNFVAAWLVLMACLALCLPFYTLTIPRYLPIHHLVGLLQAFVVPFLLLNYFPYFTLGICAYEIWSRGALRRLAIAGAVLAAAVILGSAAAKLNMFGGSDPWITVPANLLIFALLALFVIDHPLVGIFRFRPLVLVGQGSYSLYLLHQVIGISLMRRFIDLGIPYLVILPLMIAAMIGLSLLLFSWVEIPAKSWILRHARPIIPRLDRVLPGLNYRSKMPAPAPAKAA